MCVGGASLDPRDSARMQVNRIVRYFSTSQPDTSMLGLDMAKRGGEDVHGYLLPIDENAKLRPSEWFPMDSLTDGPRLAVAAFPSPAPKLAWRRQRLLRKNRTLPGASG